MKIRLSSVLGLALLAGCTPSTPPPSVAPPPSETGSTPQTEPTKTADQVTLEPEALALAHFELATVVASPIRESLRFLGSVATDPSNLAQVNSRVKAKVIALNAQLGQEVTEGEVLAVVESEDLHAAQVAHHLAQKKQTLARDTLARRRKLAGLGELERHHLEEYQQTLAQLTGQLTDCEGEIKTTRAALDEARSEEKTLQAAREQAQTRRETAQARATRAENLHREELIARQDLEQAQAELKQAQAEVGAAEARCEQGQARTRSAEAKWEAAQGHHKSVKEQHQRAAAALVREEKVVKGGYTRDKELIEAENALQQATIEVESALDDIELLGGKPGDMHSIPIHAPIHGRITERHASLGETVDMSKPLYSIFNATTIWVQLSVPPAQVRALPPGTPVALQADALPGKRFTATVVTIGEAAESANRQVTVRCRVNGAAPELRPGIFVTGTVNTPSPVALVAVPEAAVQDIGGRSVVFVATARPEVFAVRTVTVTERRGGRALVRSGLRPGERIVVRNATLLKEKLS